MKVPFVDLNGAYVELQAELDEAVRRVLESGWYILGSEVETVLRGSSQPIAAPGMQ